MQKSFTTLFMLLLVLGCFSARLACAQEYGSIKVLPPTEDCIVSIDGVQAGTGTTTATLTEGMHNVVIVLSDGTTIYNRQIEVKANKVATVAVSYEIQPNSTIQPYGRGFFVRRSVWGKGWGISLGVDNTDFSASGGGFSDKEDPGVQLNLDWFYSWQIYNSFYSELSISLFRTYGTLQNLSRPNTSVVSFPVNVDLKYRVNDNLFLGGGINYSIWSMSPSVLLITPGIGYQVFIEIKQISSEIGYIVKNGSAYAYANGRDVSLESAGIYYKYKFYL